MLVTASTPPSAPQYSGTIAEVGLLDVPRKDVHHGPKDNRTGQTRHIVTCKGYVWIAAEKGPANASGQLLLDNRAATDHYRRTDNRFLFRVGKEQDKRLIHSSCTRIWGFPFCR